MTDGIPPTLQPMPPDPMAYYKVDTPYTIPVETTIHIYINAMEHLTSVFLWRVPNTDIDTLDKVFIEEITFTKQANPNGGGLMVLAQASTTILMYPNGSQVMPS